jgi:hypothetical protein
VVCSFKLIFKKIKFKFYLDNITITPLPGETCDNDGVRDPTTKLCNCPSGFNGNRCEIQSGNFNLDLKTKFKKKLDRELCDRIECMSNGICAIRPIATGGTVYQSRCLCRVGSDGEYCERQSN